MIEISVEVTKKPSLKIKPPDRSTFWKIAALQVQKMIRQRTERQGVDSDGRSFKPYSTDYKKRRQAGKVSKAGGGYHQARTGKVNLSLSTKMLGSMKALGKRTKAIIRLSGNEGFKAWVNELKGRVFFDISKKEADKVVQLVADEVTRQNKLKKR